MDVAAGDEFRVDLRRPRAGVVRLPQPLPADALEPLTALDDRLAWRAVAATVLPLAVVLAAAWAAWPTWAVVVALPLVAALQHALFVLAHDAAHYRLFADRRLNDAVGRALGAVAGISMCTYRVVHRLHHNHLYGDADPDVALNGGYPRGRRYLLRKLATDLSGRTAWKTYGYFFGAPAANAETGRAARPLDDTAPALREAARRDRRTVLAVQAALPLACLALGGLQALLAYAVLWVLPAVTLLQAILRVRAIFEHGAPAGYDSPLQAARTHRCGPLSRFFLFPHHVGYHVEHHLYPAVPHYHLPRLHTLLADRGLLEGAQVSTPARTWRRVFADPLVASRRTSSCHTA
jgi:fatty acid desaturase